MKCRNGLNLRGSATRYALTAETIGGYEAANHPKLLARPRQAPYFFGSGSAGLAGTRELASGVPIDFTALQDNPDVLPQILPEVVAASLATAPEA